MGFYSLRVLALGNIPLAIPQRSGYLARLQASDLFTGCFVHSFDLGLWNPSNLEPRRQVFFLGLAYQFLSASLSRLVPLLAPAVLEHARPIVALCPSTRPLSS